MNPQHIIQEQMGPYLVHGKAYPRPLPAALQEWYCYTVDGGHSIMCAIKSLYEPGGDPERFLVPVPVKSVLRGYAQQDGYVVADLSYDSRVGLVTPAEDDEF